MSALSRFVFAAFATVTLLPACSGKVVAGNRGSELVDGTPDGGGVRTPDADVARTSDGGVAPRPAGNDAGRTPVRDGGGVCVDNSTRPEGDGCNTCTCWDDHWNCTVLPCPYPTGDVCANGESRAGTSTDPPCSTCTCSGGQWNCVSTYCDGEQCTPGATRAADRCNSCTCTSAGQWDCTELSCDVDAGVSCGGFLGNTCGSDEYCAYTEGALCGAADASAFCKPKPVACDENYQPVCGCNGVTYPNVCFAAAAGTGIMTSGPCDHDF